MGRCSQAILQLLVQLMTNHGGKREGAGRKASNDSKIMVSKRLDREIVKYLSDCDNATEAIEEAIRNSRKFKLWKTKQN